MKRILLLAFASVLWLALSMAEPAKPNEATKPAPKPNIPEGAEVITLGVGCFWCIEAVYQQIPGVLSDTSGYMGGGSQCVSLCTFVVSPARHSCAAFSRE